MEFRILGPLEVLEGGRPVEVEGAKQRALLAVLLLNANRIVPSDRLIDALWEEWPPERPDEALEASVSRLRESLGEDVLVAGSGGYLLRVEKDQVDLHRFEALLRDAREAALADSAAKLREALALWRGPALADFAHERFAQPASARLEELRLAALEDRIDAELALGRHAELVGELAALVAEHPSRERLRSQLMLALSRGDRRTETLAAHEGVPGPLGEQLGIEPAVAPPQVDAAAAVAGSRPAHEAVSASSAAGSAPVAGEVRKVVSIVFTDITSSTALGERLDPESLRRVMGRYFDTMRAVLERHGATIEKYIGDAVVAVFGVPVAHEDDAFRAVRAAVEMREQLEVLNAELERGWGVTVSIRTGVNTGEVIAGSLDAGHSFFVADATNMAARFQQSAEPGEILIGEATYRLVREAVVAEAVEPLTLKGKAEPVPAWRLLDVSTVGPGWTRRLDSPLVDRERELATLQEIFERTAGTAAAELVTLMGPAGAGKSRLTAEFLSRLDGRATVITGHCPPYGDGITFWPIVTVLRNAAGIGERDSPVEGRQKLAELMPPGSDAALVADRLAALLGLAPAAPGIQETFWAVRKLLERLGAQQPLVVVFEDIHWAEATFLDLLEYLADRIRLTPILIVCLARPELLDTRPGWTTAKPNATLVTLQPLTERDIDLLIRNLVGGAELVGEAKARIAEVAEGNPLFVEETLRMLVDDGLLKPLDGGWVLARGLAGSSIPPTIHALLAARLDRLGAAERAVVERASVVGRVFSWGSLSELAPAGIRPHLMTHLQSLMRKELIRPEYAETGSEDAFRFAHILMRDAAYHALPKALRSELHERLADWLEAKAPDPGGEFDEILAYHLEQAHRSLLELGPMPAGRAESLGRRAAAALARTGQRAFARGDMPAADHLLSRACALLPEQERERIELLPSLAFALLETGEFERLQAVVAEMTEAATASADADLQAHAVIVGLWIRLWTNPDGWAEVAEREATRAISAFQELGDDRGLARGWSLLALVHLMNAQFGPAEDAWWKSSTHAHRAGDRRDELESLSWVPLMVAAGPTHVDQARRRCREVLERVEGDKKATSSALIAEALLEAAVCRFEEARALIAQARGLLQEVALTVWLAGPLAQFAGWIELQAGDPAAAERELRSSYEKLREIGELSWLSTIAGILAEAVYAQGRYDEAEQLAQASEESAAAEDVYSQALLRSIKAKVLARQARGDEAERLARESVAFADRTDFLHLRWYAYTSLAEVLRLTGRPDEARPVVDEAIRLAEQKGSLVGVQRARELLERLDETESTAGA